MYTYSLIYSTVCIRLHIVNHYSLKEVNRKDKILTPLLTLVACTY